MFMGIGKQGAKVMVKLILYFVKC